MSYETVVKELVADTVEYGAALGPKGGSFYPESFSQAMVITLKVHCVHVRLWQYTPPSVLQLCSKN